MTIRHFLNLDQIAAQDLEHIIGQAIAWKQAGRDSHAELCQGLSLATLFDTPSIRTRISFNLAAQQLGMHIVDLDAKVMHFAQGKETLADTARMFNGFVDVLMYRTNSVQKFTELIEQLTVPLINGLSDMSHPCQIMADLMTVQERLGHLQGLCVLWVGDYNNVARSWAHAAAAFGFTLRIASPDAYALSRAEAKALAARGADIVRFRDPFAAAQDVDVINTDVWVSMGNSNPEARTVTLEPYQVNESLMCKAAEHAIFLHCLPANRGQEVTNAVLDGTQSAVWQQAKNRLHVQKAILAWCLERL
ncbi:MAG: ornithine carbamoyltransferase [Alphaproteobacteria bacterium]|nr:ornithine carbamoyltransferase [Alphaproteobacteria bacterium]